MCGFYFVLNSPLLTFVNSILLFQLVFDTLQKITRTACVCFKTAEEGDKQKVSLSELVEIAKNQDI